MHESDAHRFLSDSKSTRRVSMPCYERMKHLWSLGYNTNQILEVITQEFGDIEFNAIAHKTVKQIINDNTRDFELARMELGLRCRDTLQRHTALLFEITQDKELLMVQVYNRKLEAILQELNSLESDEIDPETGNFKNTSRMFVLIELADKLQTKISKLCGTDALREIEIFRKKAEAKALYENNKNMSMLPTAGRVVDGQEAATKFL